MENVSRFFSLENQSFFLMGPRGTGKSTFIKAAFPDALYLDLNLPDIFRTYSARPEQLKELVNAHPEKKVIVLDEIQKIPDLLGVVHSLIEDRRGRMFILTGSSARKLKKTGVNLLGGRALMRRMHAFMAAELGSAFNLDAALQHGLIPLIVTSDDPMASLQAYIDLYLREEVQMEGLTRNVGNFSRFLEAVSFSHGSLLNISNVARECQVERKVVEGYITILEDLLLAYRLPVFTKRAGRATSVHPKFYFFDTGVFRALRPAGPLDRPEEIAGPALEGLVAEHLRAWTDFKKLDCRLYFWRTSSGNEVDFVLYGNTLFQAIEVKNTATIRPQDLRSLRAFGQDYPEAQKILLYRGKERLLRDDIAIIPCDEFLLEMA